MVSNRHIPAARSTGRQRIDPQMLISACEQPLMRNRGALAREVCEAACAAS